MSTQKIRAVRDRLGFEGSVIFLLDNLIWPILAVVFIGFWILLPEFFATSRNIQYLLYSGAGLACITLAEGLCLLSGNFDLSVGSIAGFSAMFGAVFAAQWFPGTPALVAIAVMLVMGGSIGALNGFSVAYLGVNPFLQTLSFLIIFEGLIITLSTRSITSLPEMYFYVGNGTLFGIPFAIILTIGLYLVVWTWLKYSNFGNAIYAVGGNRDSAEKAGINTKRVILVTFILSGVFSALGGLIFTGFLGAATPNLTSGQLFPAFAAAVVGGISLFGGRGNILNAYGGVLLLGMVEAGLVMLGIGVTLINAIQGSILLAAILLYTFVERYRESLIAEFS
jgi:ribose/xylose/arabinose/galactoside ABC-type transport system permease subunit